MTLPTCSHSFYDSLYCYNSINFPYGNESLADDYRVELAKTQALADIRIHPQHIFTSAITDDSNEATVKLTLVTLISLYSQ